MNQAVSLQYKLEIKPNCSIPLNCIYLLWLTGPSPQYFPISKDRIGKWAGEADHWWWWWCKFMQRRPGRATSLRLWARSRSDVNMKIHIGTHLQCKQFEDF